jgi:hypothetical protein
MPKKTFPAFVPPMMAESAKAPFDSPDWIFEIKLDGYRAITVFDSAGKPHLWSRNGLPLEASWKSRKRSEIVSFQAGFGVKYHLVAARDVDFPPSWFRASANRPLSQIPTVFFDD